MSNAPELKAPAFLLAMPQIQDPFFQRSVVLLLAHEDEGSLGFIVNRFTDAKVADVLTGMELEWKGDAALRANFGGPVQPQIGSVLYDPGETEAAAVEKGTEVVHGIGLTQNSSDLAKLGANPPKHFRLVLGYAGWSAGQLLDEIERNDWIIAPVEPRLVFGEDAMAVWKEALATVGIDAATLPAWTGGGESVN